MSKGRRLGHAHEESPRRISSLFFSWMDVSLHFIIGTRFGLVGMVIEWLIGFGYTQGRRKERGDRPLTQGCYPVGWALLVGLWEERKVSFTGV